MDNALIEKTFQDTLKGGNNFAVHLAEMVKAGVQSYRIDLKAALGFYCGMRAEFFKYRLPDGYQQIVGQTWQPKKVQDALDAINQHKITYMHFIKLIADAGTIAYEVDILGKKSIYYGVDNSNLIEPFPEDLAYFLSTTF